MLNLRIPLALLVLIVYLDPHTPITSRLNYSRLRLIDVVNRVGSIAVQLLEKFSPLRGHIHHVQTLAYIRNAVRIGFMEAQDHRTAINALMQPESVGYDAIAGFQELFTTAGFLLQQIEEIIAAARSIEAANTTEVIAFFANQRRALSQLLGRLQNDLTPTPAELSGLLAHLSNIQSVQDAAILGLPAAEAATHDASATQSGEDPSSISNIDTSVSRYANNSATSGNVATATDPTSSSESTSGIAEHSHANAPGFLDPTVIPMNITGIAHNLFTGLLDARAELARKQDGGPEQAQDVFQRIRNALAALGKACEEAQTNLDNAIQAGHVVSVEDQQLVVIVSTIIRQITQDILANETALMELGQSVAGEENYLLLVVEQAGSLNTALIELMRDLQIAHLQAYSAPRGGP